jgi:hypothetical protein
MCQTRSCMFCRYRRRASAANLPVPSCPQENLQRGTLEAAGGTVPKSPQTAPNQPRPQTSAGYPPC